MNNHQQQIPNFVPTKTNKASFSVPNSTQTKSITMEQFDEYEERGKEAYLSRNYEGAKKWFTKVSTVYHYNDMLLLTKLQAIQAQPPPRKRFKLLDARAATCEKLEDGLDQGLRDAKAMIRADPTSARGYLRAGRLFVLKGEPQMAMDIYQRGLSSVMKAGKMDRESRAGEQVGHDSTWALSFSY